MFLSCTAKLNLYHWQELPQVQFLSRQKICCDKNVFVATKHVLSQQKYAYATKVLLRQKYVCRDKTFVTLSILLLQQKSFFVSESICVS